MARQPVFDGHNDALTREDHAAIVAGRSDGHVDLPRMRAGGMRGGIFAVFTPSARERKRPLRRRPGVVEFELSPPVGQRKAAAHATEVAGRLLALERVGEVRVAGEADGGLELTIACPYPELVPGESIAVDGACLTAARVVPGEFTAHLVRTTLERTAFGGGVVMKSTMTRTDEELVVRFDKAGVKILSAVLAPLTRE